MAEDSAGSVGVVVSRGSAPAPADRPSRSSRNEPIRRQTVEFLLVLGIAMLLLRTFGAEAYVVPTGSMAPTLLGYHKVLTCPNCKFSFVVGMDEQGITGRPVCPNCGQDGLGNVPAVESNGDRLLVQKFLFDVRRPRRWEVGVFHSPTESDQAYVKRVVGLPGETIQIVDGDIHIDGKIARKSLDEQRVMRILVHDHDYVPADSDRFPRFRFRGDRTRPMVRTRWSADGTRFVHTPTQIPNDREDWVEYVHFDPERGRTGPIRDFCPYNGGDHRSDNVVRDLMIEAEVSARPDVKSLTLRLDHGADRFTVTIPVDGEKSPGAERNGSVLDLDHPKKGLASSPENSHRFARVEASVVDRRLTVAIDGEPLFDPIDFEKPTGSTYGPSTSPLALGVLGGGMEIRRVKIFRDIFYTGNLAMGPRRPFGVDEPYVLGQDEFFVLGDNSPISNDSRFWEKTPVVGGDRFLGKPFLVHLPGQVCALRVFGRPLGWIPDPREIRYIR